MHQKLRIFDPDEMGRDFMGQTGLSGSPGLFATRMLPVGRKVLLVFNLWTPKESYPLISRIFPPGLIGQQEGRLPYAMDSTALPRQRDEPRLSAISGKGIYFSWRETGSNTCAGQPACARPATAPKAKNSPTGHDKTAYVYSHTSTTSFQKCFLNFGNRFKLQRKFNG